MGSIHASFVCHHLPATVNAGQAGPEFKGLLLNQPMCRRTQLVMIFLSCFAMQSAHALCFLARPDTPPVVVDMSMGRIVVPPNLPVGGLIARREFPMLISGGYFGCESFGGLELLRYRVPRPAFSEPDNVYQTNVPGVAVQIFEIYRGSWVRIFGRDQIHSTSWTTSPFVTSLVVQLIKSAPEVGAGSVFAPGVVASQWVDGNGQSFPFAQVVVGAEGIIITPTTCNVQANSRNIAVDFGSVSRSSFSGFGSRAADRDFAVDIDCSSTSNVFNAVGIRVDASQDGSNLPGVVSLVQSAGTARGVGIELVRRDNLGEYPLRFSEFIDAGRAAATSTRLSVPLRARYIQTGVAPVTPGKASGIATFTIEYR